MLDDHKYSVGRLVVYQHPDPKLPRQSYGHHGPKRTAGQIISVDMVPNPEPHWFYTIRNVRNQEVARIPEDRIEFATAMSRRWKKSSRRTARQKIEDGALAEIIAKALSNPEREGLLKSTLKELLCREELSARAHRDGADLPVAVGDYIRIRGDLRKDAESLHNHYAKILSVEPSDIAGIENPQCKPGYPTIFRTIKKYNVVTTEGDEASVYDAEIKLFYTANGRKTILNWRAATLLAEAFGDNPPYNSDYEYLATHVFTREELKTKGRGELSQLLASMLYVKGRMGWRDYQRRKQFFAGTPKSHLIDSILHYSRFDYRKNRPMTFEEITNRQKEGFKLRRLLKSR